MEQFSENNNNIYSKQVAISALKGHHIEIRENTIVDMFCDLNSYTYIGLNCSLTKCFVGRYCSIGNNVTIGPGEHNLTAISTSAIFYESTFDELTQKECVIGNDVWIGVDSIIKRGVKIGNGAVIGANSVVTKDIPDYAIAIGSPARILRYRFDEKTIEILQESTWWEHDFDKAKLIQQQIEKIINDIQ